MSAAAASGGGAAWAEAAAGLGEQAPAGAVGNNAAASEAAAGVGVAQLFEFFLGLFVLNEHMSPVLLTGFLIVWAALALFTFDSLRHGQRNRMLRNATLADDVEAPI